MAETTYDNKFAVDITKYLSRCEKNTPYSQNIAAKRLADTFGDNPRDLNEIISFFKQSSLVRRGKQYDDDSMGQDAKAIVEYLQRGTPYFEGKIFSLSIILEPQGNNQYKIERRRKLFAPKEETQSKEAETLEEVLS